MNSRLDNLRNQLNSSPRPNPPQSPEYREQARQNPHLSERMRERDRLRVARSPRQRRSTREELEAKGILHKSNVAHVAKKLARRSLSSTLEAQLSKRPTREELMEEGWIAARTLPTLQVSGEYEAMQHGATYTPGLESPKIHLKLQHGLFDERTTVLTPSFSLYDDESYF